MKLIMLVHLSGVISYEIGKEYDFPIEEAVRLIDADIAKPKVKKDYDAALVKIADEENEKLEKEKQIAAIQHKDKLLEEKNKLQERINAIDEILESNDLDKKGKK